MHLSTENGNIAESAELVHLDPVKTLMYKVRKNGRKRGQKRPKWDDFARCGPKNGARIVRWLQ